MDTNNSIFLQAKSLLTEYLEKRHMRKTPERFEVLRAICQTDDIFSIEQLNGKMQMNSMRWKHSWMLSWLSSILCSGHLCMREISTSVRVFVWCATSVA